MHWTIPQTDMGLDRWIRSLEPHLLTRFITDVEYLLGGEEGEASGEGHLAVATILGAARRWRDEGVRPIVTIRATAPEGFYQEAA